MSRTEISGSREDEEQILPTAVFLRPAQLLESAHVGTLIVAAALDSKPLRRFGARGKL